jgi:hypothetical protein
MYLRRGLDSLPLGDGLVRDLVLDLTPPPSRKGLLLGGMLTFSVRGGRMERLGGRAAAAVLVVAASLLTAASGLGGA